MCHFHEWFCGLSENWATLTVINGCIKWEEGCYVRLFVNVKTNINVIRTKLRFEIKLIKLTWLVCETAESLDETEGRSDEGIINNKIK